MELVRQQYASVGTAARVGLARRVDALEARSAGGIDVGRAARTLTRSGGISLSGSRGPIDTTAGRWSRFETSGVAPFHIMATEGTVHVDKDHVWHMTSIAGFVRGRRRRC